MKIRIFTLFILMTSLNALAGFDRGNGGDVIYCDSRRIDPSTINDPEIRVEFLDAYEMKLLGLDFDLGGPELDVHAKLNYFLERLKEKHPEFEEIIRDDILSFFENAKFLDGIVLRDIPDSNHIAFPIGCEVAQAVIQAEPRSFLHKRFTVNNYFWNLMSADDQATLVIHEIIYKHALKWEHEDSTAVRLLTGLLVSGKFYKLSSKHLYEVTHKINLFFPIRVGSLVLSKIEELYPNGQIKQAELYGESEFELEGQRLLARGSVTFFPNGKVHFIGTSKSSFKYQDNTYPLGGAIWFYPSGKISFLFLSDEVFSLTLKGKTYEVRQSNTNPVVSRSVGDERFFALEFHENGTPKKIGLDGTLRTTLFEQDVELRHQLAFYPNGNYASVQTVDPVKVYLEKLKAEFMTNFNREIEFYDNGSLKKFTLGSSGGLISYQKSLLLFDSRDIELHMSGHLKSATLLNVNTDIFVAGDYFQFKKYGGDIEYYSDGKLKKAWLVSRGQEEVIHTIQGKKLYFRSGIELHQSSELRVKKGNYYVKEETPLKCSNGGEAILYPSVRDYNGLEFTKEGLLKNCR